jgi:hypothetical protein
MDSEIGTIAGDVYRYLESNGSATITRLKDAIGKKQSTLNLAMGWLAREGKVERNCSGRKTEWRLLAQ